jgi:prepilin-type processing-associated H-X9-DG protein
MLERTDLFDQVVAGRINFFNADAGNSPLTTGSKKGLALDLTTCPSRGDWSTIARAWSNMHYRANGAGSASPTFNRDDGAIGDNANGVVISMADIAAGDGTSTTLLISEGSNDVWFPQLVKSSTLTVPPAVNIGGYWYEPIVEVGGGQIFGLPAATPTATTKVINQAWNVALPNSLPPWSSVPCHPGGAVVAFADGSSRLLRNELKPHVYGHLVTQRSVWDPNGPANRKYSNNSVNANNYLLCPSGPGASDPYPLQPQDY